MMKNTTYTTLALASCTYLHMYLATYILYVAIRYYSMYVCKYCRNTKFCTFFVYLTPCQNPPKGNLV